MRMDDVFHDGEPQSRAAEVSRAGLINAIKAFRKSWQVFFWYSRSSVAHGDFDDPKTTVLRRH